MNRLWHGFLILVGQVQGKRTLRPRLVDSGGAYSGAVMVEPGVWVYQITKKGLALQLTLQGTKYYKDDDLNKS